MGLELTAEQKDSLKTWNQQRDAHLEAIRVLRVTEEGLRETNKKLSSSNSDIESRMKVIQGRIQELKIKESELPLVISKEVAFLVTKKTVLESDVTTLQKIIVILDSQKRSLEIDTEKALSTFEVLKGETLLLDKIVDKVTVVSKSNSEKINLLVSDLAVSLEKIIEVNRKNVAETNIVIDKVPAMIMECQKKGLINKKI